MTQTQTLSEIIAGKDAFSIVTKDGVHSYRRVRKLTDTEKAWFIAEADGSLDHLLRD